MLRCITNSYCKLFKAMSVWPRAHWTVRKMHQNHNYKLSIIPALEDNYMYVLIDKLTNIAVAVDPVEPDFIFDIIQRENGTLTSVLTTHHHFDHAGGNEEICNKIKNLSVYGADDRIDCLTDKLSHNESFKIGSFTIKCLLTPCHTSGHACYYIEIPDNSPICFTGDTLFVGGCGKFFEGTAEEMYNSLNILSKLPGNTKIYCGHEYTLNNLKFATTVEPQNAAAKEKLELVKKFREASQPTVPSTINDELSYNPFLRAHEASVKAYTQQKHPIAVIEALRKLKDNFKC